MSQISDTKNPWRTLLLSSPASFRNVIFHVESGSRASGRRTVVHEYPKRPDTMGPYAEDMGRSARRFTFAGYVIYKPANSDGSSSNALRYNYVEQRRKLYEALEAEDAGKLVHPVFCPGSMMVVCERFTMTETRERGGYTQFDMSFVEAGSAINSQGAGVNDTSNVARTSNTAEQTAIASLPSQS